MIRKWKSGENRLYSRKKKLRTGKRRNLGTFATRGAAQKHERAVQYFKSKYAFAPGSSGWSVGGKETRRMELFLRGGNAWDQFQRPALGTFIDISYLT